MDSGFRTRRECPPKRMARWPRSTASAIRCLDRLKRRRRLPMVLRGRLFTYRDLRWVIACAAANYSRGRTEISRVVCRRLNWRQPNGWLKDRACRAVLIELERIGLFTLPPLRPGHTSTRKTAKEAARAFDIPRRTHQAVTRMPRTIEFVLAKGDANELLWNALVEKHHYLGYGTHVGRCLKYLIEGDGQILGAISYSSPAWNLALRNDLMERLELSKARARDIIIYNSRFLLLPKVRVPHLASRVLAASVKQAAVDWSCYYAITPVLAETFVEPTRFNGTTYRAANWIEVGLTTGYAKLGSSHHNSQEPKALFVYGLSRRLRRQMSEIASSLAQ